MTNGKTLLWPLGLIILVLAYIPSLVHTNGQKVMAPPPGSGFIFPSSPIKGWSASSWKWDGYEFGISDEVFYEKNNCAFIRSVTADSDTRGALSQEFKATQYRNKRMRFSAVVKMEAIDMSAALTMRVIDSGMRWLGYDEMYGRNITGTRDWQRYKVVLDVPEESGYITFGITVRGKGEVWVSSVMFEETKDEPTAPPMYPNEPVNLDFSDV